MCFSAEWSAFFAAVSCVAAFIMHRKYGSTRHTIAILFFGSMGASVTAPARDRARLVCRHAHARRCAAG